MSFGKLLATGKSFVGGHGMERYQTNPRVFLPKFISPRNPFTQTPERKTTEPKTVVAKPDEPRPQQQAETASVAAASEIPLPRVERRSIWSAMWKGVKAVARLMNPIKLFKRRAPNLKSAIPRFDKKPVQAELSLERVRVLRNELAESDLEVVPAGGKGNPNKHSPGEGTWTRLTDHVFGSETN